MCGVSQLYYVENPNLRLEIASVRWNRLGEAIHKPLAILQGWKVNQRSEGGKKIITPHTVIIVCLTDGVEDEVVVIMVNGIRSSQCSGWLWWGIADILRGYQVADELVVYGLFLKYTALAQWLEQSPYKRPTIVRLYYAAPDPSTSSSILIDMAYEMKPSHLVVMSAGRYSGSEYVALMVNAGGIQMLVRVQPYSLYGRVAESGLLHQSWKLATGDRPWVQIPALPPEAR